MATKKSTIEYISEQISGAGVIRSRSMFGEYALYCDEKVVAFVCDDHLFVKLTEAGKNFLGKPTEAPAYPGSKMYYLITGDFWDDKEYMSELIKITATVLPLPKKKPKKKLS
ncbi:MAG TPA: TfoX/Sxy family protein [Candidatus Saccharimonadales bacterium]|nr:TfoX/Sxy family protein [Candidatus Saccharimonadales bacterium]